MANQSMSSTASMSAVFAEHRVWFTILGIVLVVVGIVAIVYPLLATFVFKTFLGWLFLIGGVVQVVHAFSTQKWSEFFLNLIIGILYVLAGAWLAFFPFTGIITLTILVAALFVVNGILEIGMGLRMRAMTGWFWMLISGLIGVAAGVLIFAGLPETAGWVLGVLVGINLISSGLVYLLMPTMMAAAR